MYIKNSLSELVEQNRIYQLISDKLDVAPEQHNKTMEDICSELSFNPQLMELVLTSYDDTNSFSYKDLNRFSVSEILSYLQLTHRFYVNKKLPEIEQSVWHLYDKYSNSHKLLLVLSMFFMDYKKKLEKHINYEEQVLFPYIHKLIDLEKNASSTSEILVVLNEYSSKKFIENHTDVEEDLQKVRKYILKHSGRYDETPLPYRVFLSQLHYFEIDLCKHAMIEDNILIPKVIELEATLLKWAAKETFYKANFF
jgi:regulator of cell morphogenesis and NO signaling